MQDDSFVGYVSDNLLEMNSQINIGYHWESRDKGGYYLELKSKAENLVQIK